MSLFKWANSRHFEANFLSHAHTYDRRDKIEKDDPSCEHHLYWNEPPETVLVVKKIRDTDVTEKFKVIVKFLVQVSRVRQELRQTCTCTCIYM